MWRRQLKTCWSCTVVEVDVEEHVDNSLVQIWKINFDLEQTLKPYPQSEQKLNFMTNFNNSNNFNKFWVAISTRQGHTNQVY